MSRYLANIFEDPGAIPKEGGFLRRVSQLEMVPDDYGVAWLRYDCAEAIVAPLPFHRLFGLGYRLYWRWRTGYVAGRPEEEVYRLGGPLAVAYFKGLNDGRVERDNAMAMLRRDIERRLLAARKEGRDEVWHTIERNLQHLGAGRGKES